MFGSPLRSASSSVGVARSYRLTPILGAAIALAVLTTALASCGKSTGVLTVNGDSLSRVQLEENMKGFAEAQLGAVEADQKEAAETSLYGEKGKAGKTYTPAYTAYMLNQRMIEMVLHQQYVDTKLPAAKISKATLESVITSNGGDKAWKLLPADLKNSAQRGAAEYETMLAAETKKLGDPAAYFKAHAAEFPAQVCASHILVATEAEAAAIKTELAGGGDFAAIAKAKSTDTGSGASGGDLGCADPSGYVAEFAAAVKAQPIGIVGDPVKTEYGYHIIKVTKRDTPTYATSKEAVTTAMQEIAGAALTESLVARLKKADISVDPNFGLYAPDGGQGIPAIVAKGTDGGYEHSTDVTTTKAPASTVAKAAADTTAAG